MTAAPHNLDARVRGSFVEERRRTRAHVGGRLALAPFARLDALVPSRGRLLDFGCGHGALALRLAFAAEERCIHGVDIDMAKIAVAQRAVAQAGLSQRVEIDPIGLAWEPDRGSYDAVVICDVAYLFDDAGAARLGEMAVRALRPGGTLVVKELATRPWRKHALGVFEEFLAVRALGLTAGEHVNSGAMGALQVALERLGLGIETHRLDRGYPHAHEALVAIA